MTLIRSSEARRQLSYNEIGSPREFVDRRIKSQDEGHGYRLERQKHTLVDEPMIR